MDTLDLHRNTCVVILSDHGMYIGEHGRCGKHTVVASDPWPLYDTVARVPMLAALPGTYGGTYSRTCDALVQSADLAPTILELAGLGVPGGSGKSFSPALYGRPFLGHEAIFTSHHSWDMPEATSYLRSCITVTDREYTLVVGPDGRLPELYKRKSDPELTTDIARLEPRKVTSMRQALAGFMESSGADESYIVEYALQGGKLGIKSHR
jgi:arylsulfatase A-like enzyme